MNYIGDKLDEELEEITPLVDQLINKPKFLEWKRKIIKEIRKNWRTF